MRLSDIVAYAHSRGVLHRDLKPSNVMLGKFGETLLVDWGLAKPIARIAESPPTEHEEMTLRPVSGSSVQGTMPGAALGTPQYMSPEQAMGELDRVGPASDVYSLGATLYCILTGGPPLAEVNDLGEVLRRVALGDIPSCRIVRPDAPATLEAICRKAMSVRPEDRYLSPLELGSDIENWLADEAVSGVRESLGPRLGRWERRHRTLLRVSGLALLAVALVAIASALGVNNARQRADDRRMEALGLRKVAETRKQEADSQRDALQRLTTRLTLDRGLTLVENRDCPRGAALVHPKPARARPLKTMRWNRPSAATSLPGTWPSIDFATVSSIKGRCTRWPGARPDDRSPRAAMTAWSTCGIRRLASPCAPL